MFIPGVSPTDVTPRVGVVITDGFSNISPEQTPLAANLAKQFPNPVTMYALGVSGDVNPEELAAIGSIPTENYVNVAPTYDALSAITNHIAAEICMASKCGKLAVTSHSMPTLLNVKYNRCQIISKSNTLNINHPLVKHLHFLHCSYPWSHHPRDRRST